MVQEDQTLPTPKEDVERSKKDEEVSDLHCVMQSRMNKNVVCETTKDLQCIQWALCSECLQLLLFCKFHKFVITNSRRGCGGCM